MRRSRRIRAGFALAAIFFIYESYDRAIAQMPATGQIEQIETLCQASVYRHTGYVSQKLRKIPEQDCQRVRDLVETQRQYRGYRVFRNTYVHFTYTSPVDGTQQRARQRLDRPADRRAFSVGDELPIVVGSGSARLADTL